MKFGIPDKTRIKRCWKVVLENHFVDAFFQAVIIFFFSNLPYLIGILIIIFSTPHGINVWGELQTKAFANFKFGEIFVLISALLAPFVYVMYLYRKSNTNMPFFYLFVAFLIVLYGASITMFCMDRVGKLGDQDITKQWALGLYGLAVVVWYFAMVFQRILPKVNLQGSEEKSLDLAKVLSKEVNDV